MTPTRTTHRPAPTPPTLRRRVSFLLALAAGWGLYALVWANVIRVFQSRPGMPRTPFWKLLRFTGAEALLWALLTLPIIGLARRFAVTAANWRTRIPLHLGFALGAHLLQAGYGWALHPWLRQGPRPEPVMALANGLLFNAIIYLGVVAVVHAADAQTQALRLRNELLEAELRVLRMQLQPHFLFNTLNAVSELVHQDPASAERALTRLGDLLRWTLQSSAHAEVPLREELAALETYLDIQRLRHGDGLRFEVTAEPAALELGVPALLLQPLVENAVRHGVWGAASAHVSVAARRADDRLEIRIADDGRGLAPAWQEGTGLRTTRARLQGLYGARHAFRLAAAPGGGTRVEIEIPAHPAGRDGAEAGA